MNEIKLTTPAMLASTAMNFVMVKLSLNPEGRQAANNNVKKLLLEDMTLTIPASV